MAPHGGSQSEALTCAAETFSPDCASPTEAPPKPVAYYCQDFAWEELQRAVESNAALSHAWTSSIEDDLAISSSTLDTDGGREQCRESNSETSLAARRESSGVNKGGHKGTARAALPHGQAWEGFHTKHTTARFFKERRYLLEEFPELKAGQLKILEVGCGSGSTAVPLLTRNSQTLLHACDCSPTAVAHTAAAVQRAIGSAETARRFKGFCWDAALEPCPLPGTIVLEGLQGTGVSKELESGGGSGDLEADARVGRVSGSEVSQRVPEGGEDAELGCGRQVSTPWFPCLGRGGGASMGECMDDCDAQRPCTESDEHACNIAGSAGVHGNVHTECTIGIARIKPSSPPVGLDAPDKVGKLEGEYASGELEAGVSKGIKSGASQVVEASMLQRGPSDSVFKPGDGFDFVTLIFTLSAVHPEHVPSLLRRLHQLLRPGGAIIFRDYGLYDMTMLRFPPGQKVGDRLYRRLDGTLSYFFSKDALAQLATQAGFSVVDCEYCCVNLVNKRKGIQMKRVWLHARLQK